MCCEGIKRKMESRLMVVGRDVLILERVELDICKQEKEPWNELEWRGAGNKIGAEEGGAGGCRPGLESVGVL